MAQQDKTDWYWNGVLAGAVNNLYYDLINVDVCHVPYSTNHRNSSFFLKTRLAYRKPSNIGELNGWEVKDMKIIWDDTCKKETGNVYVLGKNGKNKAIFSAEIEDGCVGEFENCTEDCSGDDCPDMGQSGCGDWKLFTTNFVRGTKYSGEDLIKPTSGNPHISTIGEYTGIQINKYNLGTTLGYFSDEYIEKGEYEYTSQSPLLEPGNYLLVYASGNNDDDGFAGQVRMITGKSDDGRVMVDSPWLGFKVIDTSNLQEGEEKEVQGAHVSYAVFKDWGEVVGFTSNNKIYLLPNKNNCDVMVPYHQNNGRNITKIIGVADANDKIFVLTDNGYIHYSKEGVGYNKFFIDDDMFAGVDKISITAYRDMVLAFGRKHISIGVPDEQNRFWTMYNQSTTIGLRSRYSFSEYEGDLIFVSNDKRLLALTVGSTAGRYMLSHEDIGQALNGKLAALIPGDEVYVGSDENNLRIFVNTSGRPYERGGAGLANFADRGANTQTHIYKFDTLFKIRSEDHILGNLMQGASDGIYFGEDGIYIRNNSETDDGNNEFNAHISAYLVENESDWTGATNSRLASRPKLYNLAKLNRLITTLGPGIYSNKSKIKVTSYSKGIGYTYEFPISGDGNDWIGLMTSYYLEENLDEEQREKIECMLSTLQDSQKQYQPNCPDGDAMRQYIAQNSPRCEDYNELITESHGVCINDKIYELAPTMPLVTNLGENQDYCTQIKLELIGGSGDIICFGGRLAEMFVAPLFTTGPDGEYQLQPNTDCE